MTRPILRRAALEGRDLLDLLGTASTTDRFSRGLALFDEFCLISATAEGLQCLHLDLVVRQDARAETERADTRNNARGLYLAAETAEDAQAILARILGDLYISHCGMIITRLLPIRNFYLLHVLG